MEIRLGCAPGTEKPCQGWHPVEGGQLAFVMHQGDDYQVQIFDKGYVKNSNFLRLEAESRELAWRLFSSHGVPGPSKPTLPTP